jgi:spermidine synthase
MDNIEKIFWNIVKDSGKDCVNINKIRQSYKLKYDKDTINQIDSLFNKYYSLVWAKLEPVMGHVYSEDTDCFRDFVFHLLSKGDSKLEIFLNKESSTNIFKDVSKFSVEYIIKKKLFEEKSKYQLVQVFETKNFGNMLVIDNDVQLTASDEKNYHEMIGHVPLNYFNKDINVLIIGGGDGGTAREVLKHNNVVKLTMVDIDEVVVRAAKLHFKNFEPTLNSTDPRFNLIIGDGFEYVKNYIVSDTQPKFDLVIIDSTDFNQSVPLFTNPFFEYIKKIVNDKYLICFNADNVNWNEKSIVNIVKTKRELFKYVNPYGVYIPTFAGGFYSFCLVSDTINPLEHLVDWDFYKKKNLDLQYYTHKIHTSSFNLPSKLEKKLEKYKYKSEKKAKGVHYLIDFEEIPFNILNDQEYLNTMFEKALTISKMTVLNTKIHKFEPQGLTGFYLLSESHLSFHTWPENGTISIDLYTCGDFKLAKYAINSVLDTFKSYPYKLKKLCR